MDSLCAVEECLEPAVRGGLCWCHAKRRQRGVPLTLRKRLRGRSLMERLELAALDYALAEDDDTFDRARRRLARIAYRLSRLRVRIGP